MNHSGTSGCPSWFQPSVLQLLDAAGCALVIAVGVPADTPPEVTEVGAFRYLRFHTGLFGTGFTDGEMAFWAERIAREHSAGRDVYAYFNNDPEGHAVIDSERLRALRGAGGA
jgi:uncharacterized protein YecE (DUF72 family)